MEQLKEFLAQATTVTSPKAKRNCGIEDTNGMGNMSDTGSQSKWQSFCSAGRTWPVDGGPQFQQRALHSFFIYRVSKDGAGRRQSGPACGVKTPESGISLLQICSSPVPGEKVAKVAKVAKKRPLRLL